MPQTAIATNTTIYFVAYGNEDTVHYGTIPPGSAVGTGQPNLEEFDNAIFMGRRAYALKPEVFNLWEEARGTDYEPGDFVRYASTLFVRSDDDEEPWTLVLPALGT